METVFWTDFVNDFRCKKLWRVSAREIVGPKKHLFKCLKNFIWICKFACQKILNLYQKTFFKVISNKCLFSNIPELLNYLEPLPNIQKTWFYYFHQDFLSHQNIFKCNKKYIMTRLMDALFS